MASELTSEKQLNEVTATYVVLDFWAEWCKPCTQLNSLFDQLSKQYTNLKFFKVDAEKVPELTEKLQVTAVPAFIFIKNGGIIARIDGANPAELAQKVSQYNAVAASDNGPGATIAAKKQDLNDRLGALINTAPVMLFMKGTPDAPQCGFSKKMVDLLREAGAVFSSFNIFTDEEVRNGLKIYSNWPTYPQLYVNGKLIGGLDIAKEMHAEGELAPLLAEAVKKAAPPATSSQSSNQKPAASTPTQSKEQLRERLSSLLNQAPFMLFMKGVPSAPQCGFSAKIVKVLNDNNITYSSFNILADEEVRQGLKEYSNWPTYPQFYAHGKLIGGLDIVTEMAKEGSLLEALEEQ